jgi:hypothetical protein
VKATVPVREMATCVMTVGSGVMLMMVMQMALAVQWPRRG